MLLRVSLVYICVHDTKDRSRKRAKIIIYCHLKKNHLNYDTMLSINSYFKYNFGSKIFLYHGLFHNQWLLKVSITWWTLFTENIVRLSYKIIKRWRKLILWLPCWDSSTLEYLLLFRINYSKKVKYTTIYFYSILYYIILYWSFR